MKSHSIDYTPSEAYENNLDLAWIGRFTQALRLFSQVALYLIPSVALIIGSAWVAAHANWVIYLQAGTWAIGFVFLGLALDARKIGGAGLNVLAGLAIFILAGLSRYYGADLLIVATAVIAAGLAGTLLSGAKWPTSAQRSEDS